MKNAVSLAAVLLLYLSLNALVDASCRRSFNPNDDYPDDCSPHNVPCFVYGNGGLTLESLEFPNNNTRTCYRTCHVWDADDDGVGDMYNPDQCQASLTGVHNQNIPCDTDNATDTTTCGIFSPNYNDNKNYRKSTICRYDVTCPDGELLSYMFLEHKLENETDSCDDDGNSTCVDYVKVSLQTTFIEATYCGEEVPTNQFFADGDTAISVEFVANRQEQTTGFYMDITCSDPSSGTSRRRRRRRQTENRRCVEVDNQIVDRAVDSATVLRSLLDIETAREDLSPNNIHDRCREFTIRELETLEFTDGQLRKISGQRQRGEEEVTENIANRVSFLAISTEQTKSKKFDRRSPRPIRGYAKLWVCQEYQRGGAVRRAYLHRLGINPLDKPTREEIRIISKLRNAISKSRECEDFFDVCDEIDVEETGEPCQPCVSTFRRDKALDSLARQYDKACNRFLRDAACAYKSHFFNEPCSLTSQSKSL